MFECDCCGECCRNLSKSTLYVELDRGDGICKYLEGNLCSIYENRPLLCRIDECYEVFFSGVMTRKEFYKINKDECEKMKSLRR